mmetsp:Transcript_9263/g.15866  ORF Transcript_9263/g.15866 Transcript_9263/m.15866 type:complete len:225 (-) Transcript_9263:136-810(-)
MSIDEDSAAISFLLGERRNNRDMSPGLLSSCDDAPSLSSVISALLGERFNSRDIRPGLASSFDATPSETSPAAEEEISALLGERLKIFDNSPGLPSESTLDRGSEDDVSPSAVISNLGMDERFDVNRDASLGFVGASSRSRPCSMSSSPSSPLLFLCNSLDIRPTCRSSSSGGTGEGGGAGALFPAPPPFTPPNIRRNTEGFSELVLGSVVPSLVLSSSSSLLG